MNDIWNYIITAVGLAGFFLAGKKVWWCWYVNIFNQVLWFAYGWVTEQWGFVVGTFFYSYVFVRNAYLWTKEHREEKAHREWRAKNPNAALSIGFRLDNTQFTEQMRKTRNALSNMSSIVLPDAFGTKYYKPKSKWCPWWFHKRFHKIAPKVTKGVGGPKVGEVVEVKTDEDGIWITGKIDRDTPEGQATWEAIAGPPGSYSMKKEKGET